MTSHSDAQLTRALNDVFSVEPPQSILQVGSRAEGLVGPKLGQAPWFNPGRCAVFVIAGSDGGRPANGGPSVHVVSGLPVALDELPSLSKIAGEGAEGSHEELRAFGEALDQLRHRKGGTTALDVLASDFKLKVFDLVEISGERFATEAICRRVHGSTAIWFDGARSTVGGREAFARLFGDPEYRLAANDDVESGGWAFFVLRDAFAKRLPVHFFTIVLNGEPFIRYHERMLTELPFRWHWHVIEGVAELVKDTAWSVAGGGRIPSDLHVGGRSADGTTQYLDDVQRRFPNNVTVYRKPFNTFWAGKLDMVSAPIEDIREPCLLWQIDSDELWTAEQVNAVRQLFIANPDRWAAYFWCNYYVGPNKGISTRYNYAQNPSQEWLRVWRFQPGMVWDKHEPPVLKAKSRTGSGWEDIGKRAPFMHGETEAVGAVFDHFAYATEEQAAFKESYYGYKDAVAQWRKLQDASLSTGHLRDYFAWVTDETMFADVRRQGWTPLARFDETVGWDFRRAEKLARTASCERGEMKILVDGVFFQYMKGGIGRVWTNYLQAWVKSGFAEHVVFLDRGGTAPRLDGINYRSIRLHSWDQIGDDAAYLQRICDEEKASLFISTYYTTPTETPTVFMGYDMIPEVLGAGLDDLWWQQKRRAIQYAAGHIMISQSSINDLLRIHPKLGLRHILLAYCSIDDQFTPCNEDELSSFRARYSIQSSFVLLVGERKGWQGYKNAIVVVSALAEMPAAQRPLLVCVGGYNDIEPEFRALLPEGGIRHLRLDDHDLRLAYGAADAYICPSLYEGFGLPIGEAMAVGIPVLACRNSSIPEVAGEAAIYFNPRDPRSLIHALAEIRSPERRTAMVQAGFEQVKKFDLTRTAASVASFLDKIVQELRDGQTANPGTMLSDLFDLLRERQEDRVKIERLENSLLETKLSLSVAARRSTVQDVGHQDLSTGHEQGSATVSQQLLDAAMSVERRLAAAYTQLRKLAVAPNASGSSEPGWSSNLTAASGTLTALGLDEYEGPYADAQIIRPFRWQIARSSIFSVPAVDTSDAVLVAELGNIIDDQVVRIDVDDETIGSIAIPNGSWSTIYRVTIPISASQRTSVLTLNPEGSFVANGRELFIVIYDLRLELGNAEQDARPSDGATYVNVELRPASPD